MHLYYYKLKLSEWLHTIYRLNGFVLSLSYISYLSDTPPGEEKTIPSTHRFTFRFSLVRNSARVCHSCSPDFAVRRKNELLDYDEVSSS